MGQYKKFNFQPFVLNSLPKRFLTPLKGPPRLFLFKCSFYSQKVVVLPNFNLQVFLRESPSNTPYPPSPPKPWGIPEEYTSQSLFNRPTFEPGPPPLLVEFRTEHPVIYRLPVRRSGERGVDLLESRKDTDREPKGGWSSKSTTFLKY